jgi:filamentous hemagglutinin
MTISATQDLSQPRTYTLAQRIIAGVLLMTMEFVPIRAGVDRVLTLRLGRAAYAAPVADPGAPPRFQPAITQTTGSSPVPVVNITAPNAAGASLNRYRQFNVDPGGLVINNSTTGGGTLLGGAVGANPLLNGRAASVIINEVTSRGDAFASAINGAIEVYGPRADLVIANPNGIACGGCAFVNTPRITLTTGVPQFLDAPNGSPTSFDAAVAWAYDVRGGAIRIGAPGGQAGIEGTVGQIDLIAESIGLYARLRAGTAANLVAGRQWVAFDAAGNVVHAANGENAGAGYAIDASELGAVTAGQISLIATAAGPGVRVDGRLAASTGDLLISANGDVSIGAAYASRDLRASSNASLTLAGDALAGGDMALVAGRNLSSAGLSAQNIRLDAGGTLSGSGAINAAGAITMDAGGSIVHNGAVDAGATLSLHAQQDITLSGPAQGMAAAQLDARGKASVHDLSSAGSVKIDAGGDITTGIVQSDAEVRLTSGGGILSQGMLTAASAVTLDAQDDIGIAAGLHSGAGLDARSRSGSVIVTGDASADGDVLIGAAADISVKQGSLTSKGKLTARAGKGIDIAGNVQADRALELTAESADLAVRGQLYTGEALTVRAGADLALDGKVAAIGAAIATAGGSATIGGVSEFGNTLDVEAGGVATFKRNLTVVDKATLTAGGLQAGGDATIGGKLNAAISGDATLDGNLTVLSDFTLHAKGEVGLGGVTVVAGNATASSGRKMTLAGNLIADGDARLEAGDVLSQTSGLTAAVGSLNASGDNGVSSRGAMIAGADVTIKSARGTVQVGYASAQDDLTVSAGRNNESSALEAHGNIEQTAGGSIINRGTVLAGGALTQHASGDIEQASANIGKTIAASADGSITYRNTVVTGLLDLQAGRDLTLADAADAGAARLIAANRLATTGVQQIRGALTGDAATMTLDADTTSAGNAVFTARSGDLTGAGAVKAGGNLTLSAQGFIDRGGFSGAIGRLSASGVKGVTLGDVIALGDSVVSSAEGNAILAGSTASVGNTAVTAGGDIVVGKSLLALGKATMTAGGRMDINGTVDTPGNARLEAGGAMTIKADVRADGNATLIGADIANQALVSAGADVTMQAADRLDSGTVHASGNAILGGARVTSGETKVAGDFTVHGGDITLGGGTTVRGASAFTGKHMENRGARATGKRLDIAVDTLTNTTGSELVAVGDTVIGAREVRNAGAIYGANTSVVSTGAVDNSGGAMLSKESTTLHANALIGNRDGLIASDGNVVVEVPGQLDNSGGNIYAGNDLTLSLPGRTFDPNAVTNGALAVKNKLTVIADGFNNSGDWTAPGTYLDLQIQQSFINRGVLQKAGDLSIATPAAIENSGRIIAGGKLALAGSAITNTGLLHANEDLTLTAGGDIVNQGVLQAAGKLKLQGNALDNRNTNQADEATAGIRASGDIRIDMARLVDNSVGSIVAGGDVTITAPEVRNDRAPQSESVVNSTSYSKEVLVGLLVETNRTAVVDLSGDAGGEGRQAIPDTTLGDYHPDYKTNTMASPATVWVVVPGSEEAGSYRISVNDTIALPVVDVTNVEQRHGR